MRFVALDPIYRALLYAVHCSWIWNGLRDHGDARRRTLACALVLVGFPALWML